MMETTAEPAATSIEETEAYTVLLARLGRRSPVIPPEALVRHVMAIVPPQEWPTRVDALDALIRRLDAVKRDGLGIKSRPVDGRLLGAYVTGRKHLGTRPYRTLLTGIEPFEGRCDCPDFLKNSLGVCKHILTVLLHTHAKPRLLKKALTEQEKLRGQTPTGLSWEPIRPLTGPGDWLERVSWRGEPEAKGPRAEVIAEALKWFRPGETRVLKRAFLDAPAKRLELVEDLIAVLPSGAANLRNDPALRALLAAEHKRLKRIVAQSLATAERKASFKKLKRSLYPYQREGVERFLAAGRLLLADDMGLGKTAQAIAAVDTLWRTGRIRRALIIAPASLKPQWAREWAAFSDLPVHVIDGAPAERQAFYASHKEALFIINYEQLIRDLETVRRWQPDLVVLDEAQRIKNWATKTALSVKGLAPDYRLVLTGTPMENRIDELASVVEWVDDMALEPKWRLGSLHAVRADGRKEVVGVRNLDTLRQRLAHCMVRRVRQEVLEQLPPRTDTRVPVEMTDEQQEEHDALNQPIAAIVQRAKVRPLTQSEFLRLMQLLTTQRIISNGLGQLQFEDVWPAVRSCRPEESVIKSLSAPKLLELRQLIRQLVLDQGRKIVVFSQWRRMLTLAQWAVSDLLGEEGLRSGFFSGQEGQKRRTQNLVEFHDDPTFRILFASDAGGVGLNLQHASNCVINIELPWNPAVLEQRIGRVYRLGQKHPIDVYNLVCEQGIESRIASIVGSKQAFFKGLFDGDTDTVQFGESTSFLSKVERLIDVERVGEVAAGAGAESDEMEQADLADVDLGDEVADPFEPILEAADETEDNAATLSENGQIEPEPAMAPAPRREAPAAEDVRRLFSQLRIERVEDGRVRIEAPAEAATTLSALFEGMAALLRDAAMTREPMTDDR